MDPNATSAATVVVAGDLLHDFDLVQQADPAAYHRHSIRETILHRHHGGAWFLADLVAIACRDLAAEVRAPERVDTGIRAYSIWSRQPQTLSSGRRVWRVREFLGCDLEPGAGTASIAGDPAGPDLLVLDDLGLGFRDSPDRWPAALREDGDPRAIVLKTAAPLAEGALWDSLVDRFADRLTVVLDVAALRARRAALSRAVSWDLTIEEIAREFQSEASANDLGRCRRVVVHYGSAGAACFARRTPQVERKDGRRATDRLADRVRFERFLYDPGQLEGTWDEKRPGAMFGVTSLVTAGVARFELDPANPSLFITLGRALQAIRSMHESGAGAGAEFRPSAAIEAITRAFQPDADEAEPAAVYHTAFPHDLLADVRMRNQPATRSDLLRDACGPGLEDIAAVATDVILRGSDRALAGVPHVRYGAFFTVDREEIERINAIRNLVLSYVANAKDRRPLSIAVFGPPGSGKSFAIKQLARDLFGGDPHFLEFNISQMSGIDDLHTALHQVRDATLLGRIPIVFWDEFDADRLGWLHAFLAPMQDAEFRVGPITHPLGKAIFVFAGGTASTLAEFDRTDAGGEQGASFRAMKGPDFVSRLRGFVNIKGPNPAASEPDTDAEDESAAAARDPSHLVRRAIILRSVIARQRSDLIDPATKRARISASVIRGFLLVKRFLHGARSLESVVSMSDLTGAAHFAAAHLPGPDLLRQHVSADFLDRVAEGDLESEVLEVLAEAFHEGWRVLRIRNDWTVGPARDDARKENPLLVEWQQLSDAGRERNRLPARGTRARLASLGLAIEKGGRGAPTFAFTEPERRLLARAEHDRWLREKLLAGYGHGPETIESLRLHRDIVPFEFVPEEDLALDAAQVEAIPSTLAARGLTIVRRAHAEPDGSEGEAVP